MVVIARRSFTIAPSTELQQGVFHRWLEDHAHVEGRRGYDPYYRIEDKIDNEGGDYDCHYVGHNPLLGGPQNYRQPQIQNVQAVQNPEEGQYSEERDYVENPNQKGRGEDEG